MYMILDRFDLMFSERFDTAEEAMERAKENGKKFYQEDSELFAIVDLTNTYKISTEVEVVSQSVERVTPEELEKTLDIKTLKESPETVSEKE